MSKQRHNIKSPSMAEQADRHILYQKAVQSPESDIEFFSKTYESLRGKIPVTMREDFCGTALLSTEWCKTQPARKAIGVDLDAPTLAWGREHNIDAAGGDMSERVTLINANVLDAKAPKADITCAMNFSYQIFETRENLRAYFQAAKEGLEDDGLLIMDLFGGTEALDELEEEREVDDEDFTYIWDQISFNPIDNHMRCRIHFDFPDGSRMENAFSYEWRMWSIPEIRELLIEAGFRKVRIYWEEFIDNDDDDDDEMEGTGEYYEVTEVENQESWIIYIVAEV